MGNGYTFPLQTLVFRAFFHAIGQIHNIDDTAVSIFGDDCIVPVEMIKHVPTYANWLGWEMNEKKTFFEGMFRESCGSDCYYGWDVRPVMPSRPDWTLNVNGFKAFIYVLYNTTSIRARKYSTDNFDSVNAWLYDLFEKFNLGKIHFVPMDDPDFSGIRVSYTTALNTASVRFDAHGGATYSCIRNMPPYRFAWGFPWYIDALKQRNGGNSQFINRFIKDREPFDGSQPLKIVSLGAVKAYRGQWTYGVDRSYMTKNHNS